MNAAQVFVPVGMTREGLGADGTLVRPEASVDVEVLLQDRGLHEALVADGALVRAQVGVGLGVLHEATAQREHLAAHLADVQHGLEVRGDVLEDEVLLAVRARAHGARVALLAVHVQVALARPQRRELQAALAAPRPAARAVRALVQQQVLQGLEPARTTCLVSRGRTAACSSKRGPHVSWQPGCVQRMALVSCTTRVCWHRRRGDLNPCPHSPHRKGLSPEPSEW